MPKKKTETEKEELIRRLQDYIEFAEATRNFSGLAFYKKLQKYIKTHE